ncbi:molybdenum cofactor guanylyltransferase [Calditrichota bacterium GD2]
MKITEASAAIIAGGKSRRFGSPKHQALFCGRPLIEWSIELAASLSERIILIASEKQLEQKFGLPVAEDVVPGKGPLGGILTALKHIETEWLFVLPVDMPLLKKDIYFKLWERRKNGRPVVAVSDTGIESMVSLWRRSHAALIESLIMSDQLKINVALRKLNAEEVFFPAEFSVFFSNINFKEDLGRLEKISKARGRAS